MTHKWSPKSLFIRRSNHYLYQCFQQENSEQQGIDIIGIGQAGTIKTMTFRMLSVVNRHKAWIQKRFNHKRNKSIYQTQGWFITMQNSLTLHYFLINKIIHLFYGGILYIVIFNSYRKSAELKLFFLQCFYIPCGSDIGQWMHNSWSRESDEWAP